MPPHITNKLRVLHYIGRHHPICRGDLSRLTGLPSPTITNIVAELIHEGMVTEQGYQVSTGGRKPALLDLCADKRLMLGVELNAQQLTILLIDLKANVRFKQVEKLDGAATQDNLKRSLLEGIEKGLSGASQWKSRIAGVGVGISGLVDSSRGVSLRFPGVSPWAPLEVVDLIQGQFGLPTFLENNVAIRTLAELWFGKGRGCRNFLFVSVGPHIRMGIVIDGRLYRGSGGNAGELGHITYRADGPLCYCGNSGCLELFASNSALVQEIRRVLAERTSDSGSPLAERPAEHIQAEHIFHAARQGDRLANRVLDRVLEPLGLEIASLVNLFDPEAIILGGPMAAQGDVVLDRIRQAIEKRSLPRLAEMVQLMATDFGPEGGALGGGALIMQRMFEGVIPIQEGLKSI